MLDRTFASLADPTRRAIVQRLRHEREVSVGELAAPLGTSLTAIIKHIDVLRVTTEAQPRTKNGQPGPAPRGRRAASCSQFEEAARSPAVKVR